MKENNQQYGAEQIQILEELEPVRKRPGMYIGSTSIDGLHHLVYEVVDNSIDEALAGYCNSIKVRITEDDKAEVEDNGRGIPCDIHPKKKISALEVVLSTLHAGGKFGDGGYTKSGGLHGVGTSVVNALSESLEVEVKRDGKIYRQDYSRGKKLNEVSVIGESKATGTKMTFKPDSTIFSITDFDYDTLCQRFDEQAYLNPKVTIEFRDERKGREQFKTFSHEGGMIDYINDINEKYQTIGQVFKICQNSDDTDADIYFQYTTSSDNNIYSFVNNIKTPEGGYHESGFFDTLKKIANDYAATNKLIKGSSKIQEDDIKCGLTIVIDTKVSNPEFQGQTKTKLGNQEVKKFVSDMVKDFFEVYIKENNEDFKKIIEYIIINKKSREQAESNRRKTKAKSLGNIKFTDNIPNYKPCKTKDKNIAELYLNEGSSAQGGMMLSRDAEFQAGMHVGGKMKSVLKASDKAMFSNDVINNLYKVLGCGTINYKSKYNKEDLPPYNFDNLRWKRIILSTDQDIDAFQIRCLMLTAIYRNSPELIEKGLIYVAEAPLYEIEIKKTGENIFAYTEQEKEEIISSLINKKIKFEPPLRNKGLGQMSKESMARAIMNPDTRRITQITMEDAENMEKAFELWMGEDVEDRRSVIVDNFDYVEKFEDKTKKDIVDVLYENYLPYAISMVTDRAIISIDGFKPAHRKLLWTLHEKGLYGKRSKSANIVGENMSYNVHGDGSIYKTMVRMAQPDTLLHPYVSGKGNFGQHTSKLLESAHMRYTDAGASDINREFFKDINKNVVDFDFNYDGQKKEPQLLNTTFPNLLVNYNSGIAVGMASTTPSFNLKEVCDTTIKYIKNKNIDLIETLLAPDFATKGYILYDRNKLKEIYSTGKGSVTLRARYEVSGNDIVITEIPYTTSIELIVSRIKELCKSGDSNYKNITNVLDSTELKGMSITISIKKNTDVPKLMGILYKKTPLEAKQSFNMNIICLDGKPHLMGIKPILDEWLKFRTLCINRGIEYDINKKNKDKEYLESLSKIVNKIEQTKSIIENSDKDKVETILSTTFDIPIEHAFKIADMKFKFINKQIIADKIQDLNNIKDEIKTLEKQLNNQDEINKIIIEDLERVKKIYGKPRMTEIIYEDNIEEVSNEDLIEDYNTVLQLTDHGYFKKIKSTSITSKAIDKIKEDDAIITTINSTNKSEILFFTNERNVYKKFGYEFDDTKQSNLGDYLPNILDLEEGEKVIQICSIADYSKGNIYVAYKSGDFIKLSKIKPKAYQTKQKRSKLVDAYSENGEFIDIMYSENDINVMFMTEQGKCSIYNSGKLISKASKDSNGNNIFRITEDDNLVNVIMDVNSDTKIYVNTSKDKELLYALGDMYDENRTYLEFLTRSNCGVGAYLLNLKNKKEKITKFSLTE